MSDGKDITIQTQGELERAINEADALLNKSYLLALNTAEIIDKYPSIDNNNAFLDEDFIKNFAKKVRFYDITQIVLNKNENMRDKLVTVFDSVSSTGASILMHIKGSENKVSIQFGIKNTDTAKTSSSVNVLEKTLHANFPGSLFVQCDDNVKEKVLEAIPFECIVASVTDVAGLRFEEETKDRQFMQGIEKMIDTLQGETYSLLLIADPINSEDLNISRRALENLYSSLVPLGESQYIVGQNISDSVNHSLTKSITDTVTVSVTDTVTHTVGKTKSVTDGTNLNEVDGGWRGFGKKVPFLGGFLKSKQKGENHSSTDSTTKNNARAIGNAIGGSLSEGELEATGTSQTIGSNQSLQIKFENHTIKRLLERIDETLKRYNTCADLGMWNCAVYCISDKTDITQMAASVYQALVRGKNSSLENGAITLWDEKQSKIIIKALKHMEHPLLNLENISVTPGTLISSAELAIEAGLPNHSVPGIPVVDCAEFGRGVSLYEDSKTGQEVLPLGKVYNMHKEEELPVELSIDSLKSHTFITGSTGSGKSYTVYKLLSELKNKKFLIIEPAKGEYKKEFGHYVDAIYTTNPKHLWPARDDNNNKEYLPLLCLNPFSFRGETHILEHLDRLIEIFNVCWPMYAAMPAVLKEAVEKAYEDCGWDLIESENKYDKNLFPSFADVARNIRTIIDSSDYDAENKGAYKGALVTRLKSLSTGIYGQIFGEEEISEEKLFGENVIVDLSRVGSTETKSLIMGLLVLKLQEYRMNEGSSSDLKHVTVLEEAHNLLRRTSTEQLSESSNLIGKSVEMLTNAIAEMRSFGEGFIIADQAPGLLDLAVIRNTNTKIILRLPDQDDRELVGKAANLNDDQITELAKLPCGVAAVYQNEWIEPVLCRVQTADNIEEFKQDKSKIKSHQKTYFSPKEKLDIVKFLFNGTELPKELEKDLPNRILSARSRFIVEDAKKNGNGYNRKDTVIGVVLAEIYSDIALLLSDINNKTSNFNELLFAYSPGLEKEVEDEELRKKIFTALIVNLFINELHNSKLLEDWKKQYTVR